MADLINGTFEALAGLFVLMNCRQLYRDKRIRGACITPTVFFTLWGIWNLYYYPSLNQMASFLGGLSIAAANVLYISLMIRYRKN